MRALLITLFLFAVFQPDVWSSEWISCPQGTLNDSATFVPLTNLHPPTSILLGHGGHEGHGDDVDSLARRIRVLKEAVPGVPIYIPYFKNEKYGDFLQGVSRYFPNLAGDFVFPFAVPINHLKVGELDSTEDDFIHSLRYVQDSIEIGVIDAKPAVQLLGKGNVYLSNIKKDLIFGLTLKGKPRVSSKEFDALDGGDIEIYPGGVVVIGSDEQDDIVKAKEVFGGTVVGIDNSWLRVGHVDETYALVSTEGKSKCEQFAILYASPLKGLEVIRRLKDQTAQIEPQIDTGRIARAINGGDTESYLPSVRFFHEPGRGKIDINRPLTVGEVLGAPGFIKTAERDDQVIVEGLDRIVNAVKSATGCSSIQTVPLPQLFRQIYRVGTGDHDSGGFSASLPVNPNLANAVVLDRKVIFPSQPIREFEDEVRRLLYPLGITPSFVNMDDSYPRISGLHCESQVIRSCVKN